MSKLQPYWRGKEGKDDENLKTSAVLEGNEDKSEDDENLVEVSTSFSFPSQLIIIIIIIIIPKN